MHVAVGESLVGTGVGPFEKKRWLEDVGGACREVREVVGADRSTDAMLAGVNVSWFEAMAGYALAGVHTVVSDVSAAVAGDSVRAGGDVEQVDVCVSGAPDSLVLDDGGGDCGVGLLFPDRYRSHVVAGLGAAPSVAQLFATCWLPWFDKQVLERLAVSLDDRGHVSFVLRGVADAGGAPAVWSIPAFVAMLETGGSQCGVVALGSIPAYRQLSSLLREAVAGSGTAVDGVTRGVGPGTCYLRLFPGAAWDAQFAKFALNPLVDEVFSPLSAARMLPRAELAKLACEVRAGVLHVVPDDAAGVGSLPVSFVLRQCAGAAAAGCRAWPGVVVGGPGPGFVYPCVVAAFRAMGSGGCYKGARSCSELLAADSYRRACDSPAGDVAVWLETVGAGRVCVSLSDGSPGTAVPFHALPDVPGFSEAVCACGCMDGERPSGMVFCTTCGCEVVARGHAERCRTSLVYPVGVLECAMLGDKLHGLDVIQALLAVGVSHSRLTVRMVDYTSGAAQVDWMEANPGVYPFVPGLSEAKGSALFEALYGGTRRLAYLRWLGRELGLSPGDVRWSTDFSSVGVAEVVEVKAYFDRLATASSGGVVAGRTGSSSSSSPDLRSSRLRLGSVSTSDDGGCDDASDSGVSERGGVPSSVSVSPAKRVSFAAPDAGVVAGVPGLVRRGLRVRTSAGGGAGAADSGGGQSPVDVSVQWRYDSSSGLQVLDCPLGCGVEPFVSGASVVSHCERGHRGRLSTMTIVGASGVKRRVVQFAGAGSAPEGDGGVGGVSAPSVTRSNASVFELGWERTADGFGWQLCCPLECGAGAMTSEEAVVAHCRRKHSGRVGGVKVRGRGNVGALRLYRLVE